MQNEKKFAEATLHDFTNALILAQPWGRDRLFISEFFDKQAYVSTEEYCSIYQHNTAQWVMADFFKGLGLKKIVEQNIEKGHSQAAVFEDIDADLEKKFKGYKHAVVGYEDEKGRRVLVHVDKHQGEQIVYRVSSHPDTGSLLSDWLAHAKKNNLYRGKKITAGCSFMNLKDVSWEDVILPDGTKSVLQGMVQNAVKNADVLLANKLSLKRGILLEGEPGNGKCQPLSATVWTPSGPCRMGEMRVGDLVCVPEGGTAPITGIFPQGEKDAYRVTFSDGDSVECCDEHLWRITMKGKKNCKVMTLRQMIDAGVRRACGDRRFQIEMPKPLAFEAREVLMDPYTMGVLIGDGTLRHDGIVVTSEDEGILAGVGEVLSEGYSLKQQAGSDIDFRLTRDGSSGGLPGVPRAGRNIYLSALKVYGLAGKTAIGKFIPAAYKYNTQEVRWAVLQGLMDTDGTVDASSGSGTPVFNTSSEQLAQDVKEVVETLGGIATIRPKKTNYEGAAPAFRVFIRMADPRGLFRLDRKSSATFERTKYRPIRVIDKIEKVGHEQMQCIMVDHPEHLYLTDHCVVTHNTTAIRVVLKGLPEGITAILAQPSHLRFSADVKAICQMAKDLAPCVLVIEDIDWIAEDREHSGDAGKLIELMNQMDGLEDFTNVISIGTTNSLDTIEKAIKNRPGRFDRVIKISNPDEDCRRKMLKLFTKHYTITAGVDFERLIKFTDKLSGAHMSDLCRTAVEKAIEEDSYDPETKIAVLKKDHFDSAIAEVKNKDYSTYLKTKNKGEARKMGFLDSYDDDL